MKTFIGLPHPPNLSLEAKMSVVDTATGCYIKEVATPDIVTMKMSTYLIYFLE